MKPDVFILLLPANIKTMNFWWGERTDFFFFMSLMIKVFQFINRRKFPESQQKQHAVYKLRQLYPWSLLWSILLAIDPYITCSDNRGDGSGWQNHAGIHWNEFLHHYKAKVQKLCGKKKEAHPKLLMEWSCWASKQIGLLFSNFIHSIFGTAAWPRLYSGIETSKYFTEGKFT